METKARVWTLVLFFLVFWSNTALSQQQTTVSIAAEELVKIAVENIEKSTLLKMELISFERTKIEHELYRNGNRKSIVEETTTYHGKEYPENQRTKDKAIVDFNKLLLHSYNYFFLDPNDPILNKYPYECKNCYFLRFVSKTNLPNVEDIAPPEAGILDKGINETAMRMTGVIYIDKDHFFVRKYAGELDGTFTKPGVIVTKASADFEQEVGQNLHNIIVLKSAKFMFQIRTLKTLFFSLLTREHEYKYTNYRLNK